MRSAAARAARRWAAGRAAAPTTAAASGWEATPLMLAELEVMQQLEDVNEQYGHLGDALLGENPLSLGAARAFDMGFGTVDFRAQAAVFDADGLYTLAEESSPRARVSRLDIYSKMPMADRSNLLHEVMRTYFGHSHFRPGQFEAIDEALRQRHVIAVLATGHGKSLCYQLPSLITGKVTLVISPLVALMEEQVNSMKLKGLSAAYSVAGDAFIQDWDTMDAIFMSPESAVKQRGRLAQTDIGLIAVDEAHCVSEWGSDFRPEYRQLGFLRVTHPDVPVMCITATATQAVVADITKAFEIDDRKLLTHSFNRPNLHYTIREKTERSDSDLVQLVEESPCSIVYCMTIREVERVHAMLQQRGVSAGMYHAKLPMQVRMQNQEQFMRNEVQAIVCTVAFGMGIDKPDVRQVVHFGHLKSMTDYYQQTGRAGRDGKASRCTMFINTEAAVSELSFILGGQTGSDELKTKVMAELKAVVDFAENMRDCRRVTLLAHFGEKYTPPPGGCGACDVCDARVSSGRPEVDVTEVAFGLLNLLTRSQFMGAPLGRIVGEFHKAARHELVRAVPQASARKAQLAQMTREKVAATLRQLHADGYVQRDVVSWTSKRNTPKMYMAWSISKQGRELLAAHRKAPQEYIARAPIDSLLIAVRRYDAAFNSREHQREVRAAADRREAWRRVGGAPFAPLHERLLAVRAAVAADHAVQPEAVLPALAVEALCRARPSSLEAAHGVPGVSQTFIDTHGQDFVSAIVEFCRDHGHETDVDDSLAAELESEDKQLHSSAAFVPLDPADVPAPAAPVPQTKKRMPFA